ncbi:MAG: FkbM family methyltransferase [Acidobacteriota bacterium]
MIKSLVYKAVDTATFGRGIRKNIGGAALWLPSRLSRFYTSDYEPETVSFLRDTLKVGQSFIDIGAHIGLFSVLAGKLVGETGKVISFEPTEISREALKDVIAANRLENIIEVRSEAVSDRCGTSLFFDSGKTMSVTNSLVENESNERSIDVKTVTLDSVVANSKLEPDCIKIDVEGAELAVLLGAEEIFRRFRPKARLAVHPPFFKNIEEEMSGIWKFTKDYGYDVTNEGKPVSRDWFLAQRRFFDVNLLPN